MSTVYRLTRKLQKTKQQKLLTIYKTFIHSTNISTTSNKQKRKLGNIVTHNLGIAPSHKIQHFAKVFNRLTNLHHGVSI